VKDGGWPPVVQPTHPHVQHIGCTWLSRILPQAFLQTCSGASASAANVVDRVLGNHHIGAAVEAVLTSGAVPGCPHGGGTDDTQALALLTRDPQHRALRRKWQSILERDRAVMSTPGAGEPRSVSARLTPRHALVAVRQLGATRPRHLPKGTLTRWLCASDRGLSPQFTDDALT
jgi:hypothetical protein